MLQFGTAQPIVEQAVACTVAACIKHSQHEPLAVEYAERAVADSSIAIPQELITFASAIVSRLRTWMFMTVLITSIYTLR